MTPYRFFRNLSHSRTTGNAAAVPVRRPGKRAARARLKQKPTRRGTRPRERADARRRRSDGERRFAVAAGRASRWWGGRYAKPKRDGTIGEPPAATETADAAGKRWVLAVSLLGESGIVVCFVVGIGGIWSTGARYPIRAGAYGSRICLCLLI